MVTYPAESEIEKRLNQINTFIKKAKEDIKHKKQKIIDADREKKLLVRVLDLHKKPNQKPNEESRESNPSEN